METDKFPKAADTSLNHLKYIFDSNWKGRLDPSEDRIEQLEFRFSINVSPSFGHFGREKEFISRFISRSRRSSIRHRSPNDKRSTMHKPGDLQTIYLSLSPQLDYGPVYGKLAKIICNRTVVACNSFIYRVIYLIVQ